MLRIIAMSLLFALVTGTTIYMAYQGFTAMVTNIDTGRP